MEGGVVGRIRSIHPGIFTDEAHASVTLSANWLFVGLLVEADDNGIFEWKPITLKMKVFPTRNVEVPELLDELARHDIIKQFATDGRSYGAVRNFRKYQRPKKPKGRHPIPVEFRTYVGLDKASSEPEDDEAD